MPTAGGFIQADPASNALIMTAAEPPHRALRVVPGGLIEDSCGIDREAIPVLEKIP